MVSQRARRWLIRIGLALGSPLLLLGCLELVFAAAGIRVPRYVGPQAALQDYWVPTRDPKATPGFDAVVQTERDFIKLESPMFVKAKPKNGFRVFVLGESTVVGAPYEIGGFVDWFRIRLKAMLPGRFVEVVNAGNGGWFSDWISVLFDECLEHEPDLIIWLSGHNEFHPWHLRRLAEEAEDPIPTKLKQLAQNLRTFWVLARLFPSTRESAEKSIDRNLTSDRDCYGGALPRIQANFEENVSRCVVRAKRAGIPFVLCTLPRNLRTFPPRSSPFSDALKPGSFARLRWERAFRAGNEALASGHAAKAITAFEEAQSLDPRPAKLHFSLGKAYEMANRIDDARREYLEAIDRDGCPCRAQQWAQSFLRELAKSRALPLVDLEAVFDAAGKNGMAGDELIYDSLHPNFNGHERIAEEVLLVLERDVKLPLDRSLDVSSAQCRAQMRLDEYEPHVALHSVCLANAKVVLETAQRSEFTTQVLKQCRQQLDKYPDDAQVRFHLGLIEAITGDLESGKANAEQAIRESRRVRYKAVLASRNEPPYARAMKLAGVDLEAAEAGLTSWERDSLRHEAKR